MPKTRIKKKTNTTGGFQDLGYTLTEDEITKIGEIGDKAPKSHTHVKVDITDFPTIPTKTSDLTNDSGFITSAPVISVNNKTGAVVLTASDVGALPLSGGTLTGDIKMKQVGSNPSNTFGSEFYFFNCYAGGTSPYGFGLYQWIDNFQFTTRNSASNAYISTAFEINGATGITDFKIRPTVVGEGLVLSSELPTKTSDLTNDSGFITSADLSSGVTSVVGQTGAITATQIKSGLLNDYGGFAIGTNASASSGGAIGNKASANSGGAIGLMTETDGGGSIGNYAISYQGGAIGYNAKTTEGGAVGYGAESTTGFAGGERAKATAYGAVQLGEGTNSTDNTLQFRGYQLLNSSGNIPKERLSNTSVTSVIGLTGDVTADQIKTGIQTSSGGFAIGSNSTATFGGAIGQSAKATTGGAVGYVASATTGFAGGNNARATVDGAVQLGAGTNSTSNTLQFRDYQIVNNQGYIPLARNSIAQTTVDDLLRYNSYTVLFSGSTGSGNITISGGKALKDYKMIFVLGTNDSNRGTEWKMFYGWQFQRMVYLGSTYVSTVNLSTSHTTGGWILTLNSLSSTSTLTIAEENMKILEIWGID